jgi:hypothetical protein
MAGWVLLFLWAANAMAAPFDAVERLFLTRCLKCHSGQARMSNFDLTTRAKLMRGGNHGSPVVPGDASKSRLYQWIVEGKMPPGEQLDAAAIEAVRQWINAGAPWGSTETLGSGSSRWWAFEPPKKTAPPPVHWAATPIDQFLLARLKKENLGFNPPADHVSLIRRLYFDLTGLPPRPADYQLSYEEAVERLLASPHYGERWARHWLDVVRFGETDGGEHNYERFNAWPYRDWVIESFNQDKPYDQFVREQIAGDVLFPGDAKRAAATGFLVAGPWDSVSAVLNKDETLRMQARMDELDDMVTTTAHTFLALTVNCARCHDHKFDPIPARDYYRMTAFFGGVGFGEREVASEEARRRREEFLKPLQEELGEARRVLGDIEDPVRSRLLAGRIEKLDGARPAGQRRLPINPVWNRNSFPEVRAARFRFVVTGHTGKFARLDQWELLPARHQVSPWKSSGGASADQPLFIEVVFDSPQPVSEIRFASDPRRGARDNMVTVYRFEVSQDGVEWRTLCSSLDHVGGAEMDLPTVSDEEIVETLPEEGRRRRVKLRAEIDRIQERMNQAPPVDKLYAAKPRELERSYLLDRGDVKRRKDEVSPGVLSAAGGETASFNTNDGAARRLALANWIASPSNPLTARVIVNRVWQYHFGKGIVNTPSDFGVNGDRPSHPELLDWLAVAFIENGWSLKWLHRQIVLSRAYRQSSAMNDKAFSIDADNRLVWRMPLKRMDAEMLRDSILSITDNLDLKRGGPGFELQKRGARGSYIYKMLDNDGPAVWRRAVYRFVVRGGERIMMDSFDCPDPSTAAPQRTVSNTPVQALTLLNNEFVMRQAQLLADRLEREAPQSREEQIRLAYRLLYGRQPRADEAARDQRFIAAQSLASYARALFNTNEFIYVP